MILGIRAATLAVALVMTLAGLAAAQSVDELLQTLRGMQAFHALVATPPDPGTNTVIVSHRPNILDALGKDWFEIKEGEASIFRPDGSGKYALVGRVLIGDWATAKR